MDVKIDSHFIAVDVKIREQISNYGDQQDRSTSVKADVTELDNSP